MPKEGSRCCRGAGTPSRNSCSQSPSQEWALLSRVSPAALHPRYRCQVPSLPLHSQKAGTAPGHCCHCHHNCNDGMSIGTSLSSFKSQQPPIASHASPKESLLKGCTVALQMLTQKNHACKITSGHQLLETGWADGNSLPEDNWVWLPAQFQQRMDFVKPARTLPSIRRTTKQNILKLFGFAIKRYTEHATQLILHKLGWELNAKALGYFFKWSICLFPPAAASLHTKTGGTETLTQNGSQALSAPMCSPKAVMFWRWFHLVLKGQFGKPAELHGDGAASCSFTVGSINQHSLIANPAAPGFQLITTCSCSVLNSQPAASKVQLLTKLQVWTSNAQADSHQGSSRTHQAICGWGPGWIWKTLVCKDLLTQHCV